MKNQFRPKKWLMDLARQPLYLEEQNQFMQFQRDFATLLHAALGINDQLGIRVDHVEYEGGMNQAERFRELVNLLHWKWKNFV